MNWGAIFILGIVLLIVLFQNFFSNGQKKSEEKQIETPKEKQIKEDDEARARRIKLGLYTTTEAVFDSILTPVVKILDQLDIKLEDLFRN